MAVAAMFADRAESLPELQVGCARVGESGVRGSERSSREVS